MIILFGQVCLAPGSVRLATRFVGWFSKIEQPLIRDLSIGVWRFFSDLDLSEAKETRFRSMHNCFTRRLKDVAAILVTSIRLRFLDQALRDHDGVRRRFSCHVSVGKGEEMGWFEHGSTIVVFAPAGFRLCDDVRAGSVIRVGEPLMKMPASSREPDLSFLNNYMP